MYEKMWGSRPPHVRKHLIKFLTLVTLIKWLRHSDKVRDTPRAYQLSAWG